MEMIDMETRKKRVVFLEDGRVKWKGRRITVSYRNKKGEAGNPMLVLPVEFRPWIGKEVEVEMVSGREIVVRLEGEVSEEAR
ncbi:hypothetical protein J7J18_03020 [bacterium]|nr:hypothetical protein [bacterium]